MKPSLTAFAGKFLFIALLAGQGFLARADDPTPTPDKSAATTNTDEADNAWKQVKKAAQAPTPPAEWANKPPTMEEQGKFYAPLLIKGADLAKDFSAKYPSHPKAAEAKKIEMELLTIASRQFGDTNSATRLAALEDSRANDPNLSEDDRFAARVGKMKDLLSRLPDTQAEVETAARALQHDFPKHPEVYQVMLIAAMQASDEHAPVIIKEIIDGPAPEQFKEQARSYLKGLEAVGKPLEIHYTALDGREVDVTKMKGKVVLVDFWATWCGPCMAELPNVKETYAKLHPKGFEIVGISFDEDKDALEKTLKQKEMTWPQYFDGLAWQNKIGKTYGIGAIPAMWLVDKKGILRDTKARGEQLDEKVTKLLAEE